MSDDIDPIEATIKDLYNEIAELRAEDKRLYQTIIDSSNEDYKQIKEVLWGINDKLHDKNIIDIGDYISNKEKLDVPTRQTDKKIKVWCKECDNDYTIYDSWNGSECPHCGCWNKKTEKKEVCEHLNIIPRGDLSYVCKDCGYNTFIEKRNKDGNLTHLLKEDSGGEKERKTSCFDSQTPWRDSSDSKPPETNFKFKDGWDMKLNKELREDDLKTVMKIFEQKFYKDHILVKREKIEFWRTEMLNKTDEVLKSMREVLGIE